MENRDKPDVTDLVIEMEQTDIARSIARTEGIHTEGISLSPETVLAMPGASFGEVVALLKDERATRQQAALNDALAMFQGEAPAIHKGTKGGQGCYARYEDVMMAIRPLLARHGLAVTFDTELGEGRVTAVATIKHRLGGSFQSRATVPIDSAMRANESQKMGSAISYAKRYCLTAALNLVTSDEDDDGQAAGTATITEAQSNDVYALIDQIKDPATIKRFWAWIGVQTAEQIPATKLAEAVKALNAHIKKQGGSE